jgi:hypothetical protein
VTSQETAEPVTLTGEVHPFAERFPMLAADELDDLAADIAANGLLHPIVLDVGRRLIDGRNRLVACEQAGVDPVFTVFEGDPVRFILGVNLQRRHLSKGQRAMLAALADGSNRFVANQADVTQSRIAKARTILRWAPADAELTS